MTLRRTARFRKQYRRLPTPIQKKADRQLRRLIHDPHHPGLHVRKLVGTADIWEARVDYHTRPTFQVTPTHLILRAIGSHAIYRQP